jgi:plastocyanin
MLTHRFSRIAALASATLLIVLGAGCSGSSTNGQVGVQPLSPSLGQTAQVNPYFPLTWLITVGENARHGGYQGLDFFTDDITIDAGDSIQWTVGGNAHTVTFFGRRTTPLMPIGKPYGGTTYDGNVYTSSGVMFPGQTYTLRFTKPGTYPYECLLHDPEMSGTITVQAKGTPYPHFQSYYNQIGRAEAHDQLQAAIDSVGEFPYPNHGTTLAAGIGPGLTNPPPSNSTVLRFLDTNVADAQSSTVTIPVGTTLTWNNLSNNEPHTVTFPKAGHGIPVGKSPFAPPSGGSTYDGSHLTNSGPMFPGQGYSLTFTAKGTFVYFCLFHAPFGMQGTVIVQ